MKCSGCGYCGREHLSGRRGGLGLGSVIIGVIKGAMSGRRQDNFAKVLKFPENYEFKVAIAVGHKAVEKEPHEYDMERNISYIE